ncbi:MAG: glycosyltransferase family 4 protein [Solirubrobacteraceae bacterium]
MADAALGVIDRPVPESTVDGPAVIVSGWVIFPGGTVDYVEIFRDGMPMGRASWGSPRPDLPDVRPDLGVEGLTAGFLKVIPVEIDTVDRACHVHVLAVSSDGREWRGDVRFAVRGVEDPGEPIGRIEFADVPARVKTERPAGERRWCVFTHSLNLGGGELYLQELLLRVKATAPISILVVAPVNGPLREELEQAGILVHVTTGYPVDPDHLNGRIAELVQILRTWDPEFAIVNTLGLFPAVEAANRAGIPVAWAIHESFELRVFCALSFGPGTVTPAVYARFIEALRCAELIYESEATLALHAGEVPGVRARVIRYGIDLDVIARYRERHERQAARRALGFRDEDRVLLCMGVMQDRKNQIPLLKAFVEASTCHARAKLVFVGSHPGYYAEALHKCLDSLGARDRVRTVDIGPDTYRWYNIADVLVSAADVESLPRSILEGQAFSLPVLAADVFGVREVVEHGATGWLFEPGGGTAMIRAIADVLAVTDAELERVAERAYVASRAYDGAGYAAAYLALADELGAIGPAAAGRPADVAAPGRA